MAGDANGGDLNRGGVGNSGGSSAGTTADLAGTGGITAGAGAPNDSAGAGGEGGANGNELPEPPHATARWACNGTHPYHVSPTGSDANAGSAKAPFATVQHALSVMVAGDELVLHTGTYAVSSALNLDWVGKATAPTCIVAADGELPVLDGGGVPSSDHTPGGDSDLINIHGSYIVLDSLTLQGARSTAVDDYGAQHVDLINLHVEGSWQGAIWEEAQGSDVRIAGSSLTGNCQINSDGSKGGQCHVVVFWDPSELLIDSVIARNYGTGACLINAQEMHVARNTFIDNSNWHIKLENPGDALLERNQLYTTSDPQFFSTTYQPTPYPAIGILLDGTKPGPTTSGVFIKNNLVVGGLWGLSLHSSQPETVAVANNTFYGSLAALLSAEGFQPTSSSVFNNAFVQLGSATLVEVPADLPLSNNGFYRVPPGVSLGDALGTAAITAAPRFASSDPHTGDDFALQPSSPYVGSGMVLSGVTDDLFGRARAGPNDIGALQK